VVYSTPLLIDVRRVHRPNSIFGLLGRLLIKAHTMSYSVPTVSAIVHNQAKHVFDTPAGAHIFNSGHARGLAQAKSNARLHLWWIVPAMVSLLLGLGLVTTLLFRARGDRVVFLTAARGLVEATTKTDQGTVGLQSLVSKLEHERTALVHKKTELREQQNILAEKRESLYVRDAELDQRTKELTKERLQYGFDHIELSAQITTSRTMKAELDARAEVFSSREQRCDEREAGIRAREIQVADIQRRIVSHIESSQEEGSSNNLTDFLDRGILARAGGPGYHPP
jgi:chromosome segregation ATPase